RERLIPCRKAVAPHAAVLRRLVEAAGEQHLGSNPCLPGRPAVEPVVGGAGAALARGEAVFGALDDAALAGLAADQRVDCRPRDRRRLQALPGFGESAAGLEYLAQQVVGRDVADAPGLGRVQRDVEGPQPGLPCAAPHRRLVDAGREPARRRRRQHADIAGPGDAVERAGGAAHPRDLDVTAEPRKRPVEIARMRGPAGAFHSVTWPGYVGVLTASAPGRFAACINQAPMWRRTRQPWLRPFDITLNAAKTWRIRHIPPDHLLREVFETCGTFAEARQRLETTPIARPAIYTLVGCETGERCVIERTEDGFTTRE